MHKTVDIRTALLDDEYYSGFTFDDKTKFDSGATVDDFPNYRFANNQYILKTNGTESRILVTAMPFQKFGYLDSIRLSGVLNDIRLESSEWLPYYRKLGVHYTMFSPRLQGSQIEQDFGFLERIRLALFSFKTDLRERVIGKFSSHASALILGMLLGERDELSKNEKAMFNQAGLSHILVVSGYNISLMITFIFAVLKFMSREIRIGTALIIIILFVLLVGYEASVVRAALMGSIIIFSKINLRPGSAVNVLYLVATIMLVINPYSIFDAGFHLSFIATYSLLIMPDMKRVPEFAAVTIWVFAFVLPYIAYLTGFVSPAGIASNIAVTFLLPIFMLGSLVALVLSYLHLPLILDVLLLESMSRYVFMAAELSTRLPVFQMNTPLSIVTAGYVMVGSVIIFAMNRYTTEEFMRRRYQRFVPLRPS